MVKCSKCGKNISDIVAACPHCGTATGKPDLNIVDGRYCSHCQIRVRPVVTNVGGGSCAVGSRETWKCPRCAKVIYRSGCFVATVAYGDEDFIEVQFLRAFRDEVLAGLAGGRVLIWLYYRLGPYVARVVELSPALKRFCRLVLDKVVERIESNTHLRRSDFRKI